MEIPNNGDLPADIIREILLRLPVKTLLQFKCVCKHWCSLIGSQSFANEHFGHGSNQERLLIRHFIPNEERYAFALYDDEVCCAACAYEEPDHLQMPDTIAALMGPLNGVFCVVNIAGSIALLNPAMKQFKPIPSLNPNAQPHLSSYDNLRGFGLDVVSGDYKLVSLQYYWNEETDAPHYPCIVSVYSSGTNSWRHFEDVDLVNSSHCAYRSLCNTYLNGFYYWLMEFNNADVSILAFDMASEKFLEIRLPDCIKSKEGDLTVYGDSIALLSCDLDKIDKCVDIWVMEREGCWIKSLTVGPFVDIRWPLGFWKKNELLLETGTALLTLYNVSTKKLRTVEARRKENGFFIYWVFSYKESLVSLKGEVGSCKLWDTSSDSISDLFV